MLAVVGSPSFTPGSIAGPDGDVAGLAAAIALAAAAAGAEVQLVGKVGDDPAGDAVLLALARGGVGHLALLRDPGQPTPIAPPAVSETDPVGEEPVVALLARAEAPDDDAITPSAGVASSSSGLVLEPADISLGLRYIREFRVLVATGPLDAPSVGVVADAAAFVDAALVLVTPPGRAATGLPGSAVILEAPVADPDGAFAALVGRLAAALDRGVDAADAFRTATAEGGWERAGG
ncbi:MAG TPA: PfkB family carbohydrate kinase [Candidatus Limnocylindrales bacterium]